MPACAHSLAGKLLPTNGSPWKLWSGCPGGQLQEQTGRRWRPEDPCGRDQALSSDVVQLLWVCSGRELCEQTFHREKDTARGLRGSAEKEEGVHRSRGGRPCWPSAPRLPERTACVACWWALRGALGGVWVPPAAVTTRLGPKSSLCELTPVWPWPSLATSPASVSPSMTEVIITVPMVQGLEAWRGSLRREWVMSGRCYMLS